MPARHPEARSPAVADPRSGASPAAARPAGTAAPFALGLRALRGGAAVVGVVLDSLQPAVVLARFVEAAAEDDRFAREPHACAAEKPRGPGGTATAETVAAVAAGRLRQERAMSQGVDELLRALRQDGHAPVVAALLVNRAGWVSDLLAHALSAPEHPAVMDGLAVRQSLRVALARAGLRIVETDEKSLPEAASVALGLPADDLEARLKAVGQWVGPPWRKEQKMACLAAWLALATAA